MRLKLIVTALACAFTAAAQTYTRPESDLHRRYQATCAYTANASAPTCVFHLPVTQTSVRVRLDKMVVRAPAATTAAFAWYGEAPAGGTTVTPRKMNTEASSVLTVKMDATSANETSTVTLAVPDADRDTAFSLTGNEFLPGASATRTLKVTLGTLTGSGIISLTYSEY